MQKNLIKILAIIILTTSLSGCGDNKIINGKKYRTYGFINKDGIKDDNIEYRTVIGNVVWSVILFQTIIAPVYFIGFSLYEPVGLKNK